MIFSCFVQPVLDWSLREELADNRFQEIVVAYGDEFLVLEVVLAKVFVEHHQGTFWRKTGKGVCEVCSDAFDEIWAKKPASFEDLKVELDDEVQSVCVFDPIDQVPYQCLELLFILH